MKYDCKKLLLDIGLSTRRSKQLASALQAAIDSQTPKQNNTKIIETIKEPEKIKKKKNKDINEVVKREV